MNTLPVAAGLLLLATGAFAGPITLDPADGAPDGIWARMGIQDPRGQEWAFHHAPRAHGRHERVFGLSEGSADFDADDDAEAEGGPACPVLAEENPETAPGSIPSVPEPSSLAMIGAGVLGLLAARAFIKRL